MTRAKKFSIIVALDASGGFAKKRKIPWNYPEDFKRFQKITKGGICIMGRHTHEEMLGMQLSRKKTLAKIEDDGILPQRESIVLSRDPSLDAIGARVEKGLTPAMSSLRPNDVREIFILGGGKLFVEALPYTQKVYLTVIDKVFGCDQKFLTHYLDQNFKIIKGEKSSKNSELFFLEYQLSR